MKKKIGDNGFTCPMPMVLVGAEVDGKSNFMPAAWVSRVNFKPPLLAVALGPHHTNKGIEANREFSVNIPGADLLKAVDYCGLVSGKTADKSGLFKVFSGELKRAPMIEECPLTMECRLKQTVDLGYDILYIADIVGVYCDEKHMTGGAPDPEKIKPFTLTMPDNSYWALGEKIGKAWSDGKYYKSK